MKLDHVTIKLTKKGRIKREILNIARQMVKGIANEYIDVEDTSAGRSAQRFWYVQAEKLIKQYTRMLKLTYKTSTITKSSKSK